MPKGAAESLLNAWKDAGSPDLEVDEGETDDTAEENAIPLEAEDEDAGIPLEEEEESGSEAQSPESGTAESEEEEWPDDVPETYFGRDLKEYAKAHGLEATKVYHSALKDATKDYNRRLEELAEERKNLQPAPQERQQAPADEEPDVDAILQEMGVNTNNAYAEEIKDDVLAPMARMIAELRTSQESTASSAEADKFERDFFAGISDVEGEFGEKLPLERNDILDFAISRDIYSPRALYLTLMGPVWKAEAGRQSDTAEEAKKTAAAATKKAKQAASRQKGRRSSSAESVRKPPKKGSIEDAARAAARSLGRSVVKLEK